MSTQPLTHGIPEWTFADRCRKARVNAGFDTQEAFADAAGISRGTVGNYESGSTKRPIRAVIAAWALATGVPAEWLRTGENASAPGPDGGGEQQEAATYWYGDGAVQEMGRVAHLQVAA